MTFSNIVSLFIAMVVLAAIPSLSVLTVTTRAATYGFVDGVFTTIGLVTGDIIFILIAIWGLSFLSEAMGSLFIVIKYLGGAYLVWLGISLCRSKVQEMTIKKPVNSSLFSSFVTGLVITLGDQKATLFYLGFLPAFLDVSKISYLDTIAVILVATLAVGGVKLMYALMADKVSAIASSKTKNKINLVAGCVMIAVGIFVIVKA
ncbi:LysE family translocator [Pseudanabaena minima]|uniref:LysE family translocator n=1 Tax=Pseudanabaena minima TaxID=890415 RepID=UPI003DA9CC6A